MESIFTKKLNLVAPGGDNYEWKEAETSIHINEKGWYLIEITASAKNAMQNNSTDDDDLRIVLNGYHLGKYDLPGGKEHYQGFDSAASWNGSTLNGNSKTIYLFFHVKVLGYCSLQFYADGTPRLGSLDVFKLEKDGVFSLANLSTPDVVDVDRAGIPWMGFVFIGPPPQEFKVEASGQSGRQKNGTDGDNLKIVINGKIIQNLNAPTSDKYKNFYFSGDQLQGSSSILTLDSSYYESLENSIEVWYDQHPSIESVNIKLVNGYSNVVDALENTISKSGLALFFWSLVGVGIRLGYKYSSQFLSNSLKERSDNLSFSSSHDIINLIKKEKDYEKLLGIIKKEIIEERYEGEIFLGSTPETTISFEDSRDLHFSIHGVKKLGYKVEVIGDGLYKVKIIIYDIYDFNSVPAYDLVPVNRIVTLADAAESLGVISNFEILIEIDETIKIP